MKNTCVFVHACFSCVCGCTYNHIHKGEVVHTTTYTQARSVTNTHKYNQIHPVVHSKEEGTNTTTYNKNKYDLRHMHRFFTRKYPHIQLRIYRNTHIHGETSRREHATSFFLKKVCFPLFLPVSLPLSAACLAPSSAPSVACLQRIKGAEQTAWLTPSEISSLAECLCISRTGDAFWLFAWASASRRCT